MIKAKHIIIILTIILIIVSVVAISINNQKNKVQDTVDLNFRVQLSSVRDSFSMKVNDYTYRYMLSSVYSVARMSELTSYEKVNDNLDISLHNLYISLREDNSKELVLARIDELRGIFTDLVRDPSSRELTDKIDKIVSETFFR